MKICKRLFLVGMALGLVLAGCGGGSEEPVKSDKTAITALTLTIGTDYEINFGTDKTAKVRLPEGTTMPTSAIVKSVTLSAGASGLDKDQVLPITEGSVTVTITAEDGTTTQDYTVTVKVMESLSDYSLSYPIAKRSAGGSISVSPVWKKGSVDGAPVGGVSYASTPSLPTGLTLNADGTISGTMPSLDKVTAYQITATGDGTDYVNTATGTFLDKFVSEETYTPVTTGTAISNIAELQAMTPSGEYYLTAHIDLTTVSSWTPIASSASPFTGTLHGNGYAIYNLTIDAGTAAYQGLFASVSGATIENLSIGVANIKGKAGVGALAGYAETATLSNIAVAPMVADAKIEATGSVVIGGNEGAHLGGAVGYQDGGSLTGYSLVSVQAPGSSSFYLGGFVGYSTNGTVSGYATGNVLGEGTSSGRAGGFVGYSTNGTVSGYATGNVTGWEYSGGLVGQSYRSTISGYATGAVVGDFAIGGLIGLESNGTIVGYWDKTSTGQDTSAGGAVGITATRNIVFTVGSGYTDSGNSNPIFDITAFTDIFDTTNGANKTWPKLKSDSFALIQPTVSDLDDDGTIEVVY